jgi:radical SAM protein with 4Fe4S-binding SPASM domain
MKKLIKQTMLQYGGYTTARIINAQIEYHSLSRRYHTFIETGRAPLPDHVMFEPTQLCNLKCKMCFQKRDKMAGFEELSVEHICEFFDRAPFLQKVTLIGGEVFMRSDITDLIRHLNTNHDIVICTNGTLLDDFEINIIKECNRLYTICISLDGPREIHESIRGVTGSYDKAAKTIKALSHILPVTANLVIQDENLQFIPDMIDICASLQVKKVKIEMERIYSGERLSRAMTETGLVSADIPIESGERTRGYTLQTLQSVLRECLRRGRSLGIDVFVDPPYLMDNLEACYEGNLLAAKKFICHIMNTATIAPNGDVLNCIHIRKPFGNILDAPFQEIWNSETANTFRRQLLKNNLTPLCEKCPFMRPAPKSITRRIQFQ